MRPFAASCATRPPLYQHRWNASPSLPRPGAPDANSSPDQQHDPAIAIPTFTRRDTSNRSAVVRAGAILLLPLRGLDGGQHELDASTNEQEDVGEERKVVVHEATVSLKADMPHAWRAGWRAFGERLDLHVTPPPDAHCGCPTGSHLCERVCTSTRRSGSSSSSLSFARRSPLRCQSSAPFASPQGK